MNNTKKEAIDRATDGLRRIADGKQKRTPYVWSVTISVKSVSDAAETKAVKA